MRGLWILCAAMAATGLFLAVAAFAAVRLTPLPQGITGNAPASTEFFDRHGQPLRSLLVDEDHYRRPAGLAEMSPHIVAATLAAEDLRFFEHDGIDFPAVVRAAFNNLRGGRPRSGASTVTQQLVKEPGPRTVGGKLREMLRAARLEREWTKPQILEAYLNRVDYGNLRRGIAAASAYYFGKPPSDLSAAEAAFLAALPKAPTRLDPHRNWPGARARQQWILGRMAGAGALSPEEYERARQEPLNLQPPKNDFAAPHFVDLLLQRRGILPPEGGDIRTTLDLGLSRHVEAILSAQLARLADKHATGAAAVVLHNPTGDVLALAGSGDYFASGAGQINGAWIPRSPGSAIKPFTYLLALENGAHPGTVVPDVPAAFVTPTGIYRPNNFNHRFHGPVSLRHALGNSLNVAAVHTLESAGGPAKLHGLLRDLDLSTLGHPPGHYGLGLTLGNGEVRLLELANAYATLARGGRHLPFRLLDGPGPSRDAGRRLFAEDNAYLVTDMLADNHARAATFGLQSYLALPFPAAVKTGTSSDYRDNWVVGYTPEFTVAVWVGNPDGRSMRGITGVTGAAPAWHEIFLHLHNRAGTSWFARPESVKEGWIHPLTGHRVDSDRLEAVEEIFVHAPRAESAEDYDKHGRVVLPPLYREWLAGPQNGLGDLAAAGGHPDELRILSPAPGTVFFLDPDLPRDAQRLRLEAVGADAVSWSSPTLELSEDGPHTTAALHVGHHTITGTRGKRTATTWITVREL